MQDKIETIKKQAREFPITELLDKPKFLDIIISKTIAQEDIDDDILDLFELGFEQLKPDFEKVQEYAEAECRADIEASQQP